MPTPLSPDSPDLNPIEQAFSNLNTHLRKNLLRSVRGYRRNLQTLQTRGMLELHRKGWVCINIKWKRFKAFRMNASATFSKVWPFASRRRRITYFRASPGSIPAARSARASSRALRTCANETAGHASKENSFPLPSTTDLKCPAAHQKPAS